MINSIHDANTEFPKVDVTESAKRVDLHINATDDVSGIYIIEATVVGPLEKTPLTETTLANPPYILSLNIPPGVEPGTWTLKAVVLTDVAENKQVYNNSDLWGADGEFEVVSEEDTDAPDVASIEIDDSNANADNNGTAMIDFRFTDVGTGIFYFEAVVESPNGKEYKLDPGTSGAVKSGKFTVV